MRFHLVGLPHSQVTSDFSSCAFTEKLRKFTVMMKARGHEVLLYAGDRTEAPCDELIPCFTEAERLEHVGERHYTNAVWSSAAPGWRRLNENAIREIRKRARPRDFVCISGGIPPVLLVRQTDGTALYFLLVSASGQPVNREVLDLVAEPVSITGDVIRQGDQLILRADPRTYRRVAGPAADK